MKDNLAERLLGTVLDWSGEDLAKERPILIALARLKYDEYHQFAPGMKFIESLACWLNQFPTMEERRNIYWFVRNRLIFISGFEMSHLVDVTFPFVIRPIFLQIASEQTGIPLWKTAQLSRSEKYKELKTCSLFLGLSDGAKIDRFRRTNNSELSNEQILPYYDLSKEKVVDLKKDFKKALAQVKKKDVSEISNDEVIIKQLFLLDDFSASGLSMIRTKDEGGYGGKIVKIQELIQEKLTGWNFIDQENLKVYVILYVMTEQAKEHIMKMCDKLCLHNWQIKCVIPLREDSIFGKKQNDCAIKEMVDKYYDADIMDEHLRVGGTEDVRLGFAACGLPLILSHNTPNDSLFLLWSYSEKIKGLFPRVPRHKGD